MAGASGEDGAAQPGDPHGGGWLSQLSSPWIHHSQPSSPSIAASLAALAVQGKLCPSWGWRRKFAVPCPSWETLPFNIILSTWDSDFCSVWDLTAENNQRKTEGRRLLMLYTNTVHHPAWGSTRVDAAAAGGAGAAGRGQKTSTVTRGQHQLQKMWTLLSPPSRTEILLFIRRWWVFSSQCQGQNGLCEKLMWEALPA